MPKEAWGRWGVGDERGAFNSADAAAVKERCGWREMGAFSVLRSRYRRERRFRRSVTAWHT
jgi:hypothetical protein